MKPLPVCLIRAMVFCIVESLSFVAFLLIDIRYFGDILFVPVLCLFFNPGIIDMKVDTLLGFFHLRCSLGLDVPYLWSFVIIVCPNF